jgi:hypothetical protein
MSSQLDEAFERAEQLPGFVVAPATAAPNYWLTVWS